MTRIIAGLAKGRRLQVPDDGTRPTSDRAREGLFNTLAGRIDLEGARVLDLYAGTGAVGLEALSRGAASVVLVESDRRAVAVLRRNVGTVGLTGARVEHRPVAAALADASGPFDLVFADPPYALDDETLAAVLQAAGRLLAEGGVIVVERSARGPEPRWPDCVTPLSQKRYGEAVLWYGRAR
ncbi:RsmD family RNA methyltransferase [Jatrophihabitans fulvus]